MNKSEFAFAYDNAKTDFWRRKRIIEEKYTNKEMSWEEVSIEAAAIDRSFIARFMELMTNYVGVNYEEVPVRK